MKSDLTRDTAIQLLKASGLSVTAQRLAILETLAEHPHSSAESIRDHANSKIGVMSKQSVYDSLSLLAQKKVIRFIQPKGSATLYEFEEKDNHHHIICKICSATQDVDSAIGKESYIEPSASTGYQLDDVEVIYWGICPQCQS